MGYFLRAHPNRKCGDSVTERRKGEIHLATQLAETPPLYGKDAEDVLKQIGKAPDKRKIEQLKSKLDAELKDINMRGKR